VSSAAAFLPTEYLCVLVYQICCGIDVHKSFVVACIAATNGKGVTSYKWRRFSTFTGDLRKLANWLSENDCRDVCIESIGKYWIPVYNVLEPVCNLVLAHPKRQSLARKSAGRCRWPYVFRTDAKTHGHTLSHGQPRALQTQPLSLNLRVILLSSCNYLFIVASWFVSFFLA
jgi:hypothetical protein